MKKLIIPIIAVTLAVANLTSLKLFPNSTEVDSTEISATAEVVNEVETSNYYYAAK